MTAQPIAQEIEDWKAKLSDPMKVERLRAALEAMTGYLLNAAIGLESGGTKKSATAIIDGALEIARQALADTL